MDLKLLYFKSHFFTISALLSTVRSPVREKYSLETLSSAKGTNLTHSFKVHTCIIVLPNQGHRVHFHRLLKVKMFLNLCILPGILYAWKLPVSVLSLILCTECIVIGMQCHGSKCSTLVNRSMYTVDCCTE
jgi:hypothetical protein